MPSKQLADCPPYEPHRGNAFLRGEVVQGVSVLAFHEHPHGHEVVKFPRASRPGASAAVLPAFLLRCHIGSLAYYFYY